MQPQQQPSTPIRQTPADAGSTALQEGGGPFAFDAWMWQYIQTELRKRTEKSGESSHREFADDDIGDGLELAWKFLNNRKYHQAQQQCRETLDLIEQNLAQDFAYNLTASTLYDDDDEERRECYLDTLNVYQKVLLSQIVALLLETDDIHDIDPNYARYRTLRRQIEQEISKVAYLLGDAYDIDIFLTTADLPDLDDLVRRHCQFLLKSEFFTAFKIVIQTLGSLDRKDFHRVTEPYKNLRDLCEQCLDITTHMQDERFFGPEDLFIEKYEHDVNVYLQILWYLGLKSDLNKVDKFLHPNTYGGGQDTQTHVFAAIELLQDILPHLQRARAAGLGERAGADILEVYAEHWYVILKHETAQIRRDRERAGENAPRLQRIDEMKAIIDQYTLLQTKTRQRVEFAHKFLKKTRMAFRVRDHNIIQVPNPEGRKLKDSTRTADFLEALSAPLFAEFFHELRLQYRSRSGIKMQRLRWSWFAERTLPEGFFEPPHYNYLAYIHERWKDKVADHYHMLRQLSRRDE